MSGYTALHFAAEKGHVSACAVLLQHGAEANAQERRQKYTPLHLAAGKGRDKVVELLIESGAEIQVTDADENTALHKAAAAGQVKVVELLISKRANLIATNKVVATSYLTVWYGTVVVFIPDSCSGQAGKTAYHLAETDAVRALLPQPEDFNSEIDEMLNERRQASRQVRIVHPLRDRDQGRPRGSRFTRIPVSALFTLFQVFSLSMSRKYSWSSSESPSAGSPGQIGQAKERHEQNSSSSIASTVSSRESRRASAIEGSGIVAGFASRILGVSGRASRVHVVSSSVQEMGAVEEAEEAYPGEDVEDHAQAVTASDRLPGESAVVHVIDGAKHVTVQTATPISVTTMARE